MVSTRFFWITIGILIVLKSILVGWWPFLAIMNMPHDASLFVGQAMSLVKGEWLGPYSEYTLMKGPVTPMWMALMYFLGLPYLFSLHLLYVVSSLLCLLAFSRLSDNRGFLLFAFALVLFNPYSLSYGPLASGFREGLHQPVQLAVVGLSIILFVDFVRHRKVKWEFTVLMGVFFFMFWNNREEGMWILPYFSLLALVMLTVVWRRRNDPGIRWDTLKLAQLLMVPLAIWWTGTMCLAWKNYLEYEVFAVVELKTPEFGRAYGNMIAIEPEKWSPDMTLQVDVLDKIYSLPSGNELDLNGRGKEKPWSLHNTNAVWLFRRAVNKAGYYDKGGAEVLAFYDRLGKEIEEACAEPRFDCGRSLLNALPPWKSGYNKLFLNGLWQAFSTGVSNGYDLNILDFHSAASSLHMLSIERMVNAPVRVKEASNPYLPTFFNRMIKIKTKYVRKLQKLYYWLTPALFGIAMLGLVSRIVFVVGTRKTSVLDAFFVGLGMSVAIVLSLFSLMIMTGITASTRLYFLLYPVLFPFLVIALLSLVRDVKELLKDPGRVLSS